MGVRMFRGQMVEDEEVERILAHETGAEASVALTLEEVLGTGEPVAEAETLPDGDARIEALGEPEVVETSVEAPADVEAVIAETVAKPRKKATSGE